VKQVPIEVTDPRSNPQDQIAHAARVIGRSKQRLDVFRAIYTGKNAFRTVSELTRMAGLPPMQVLQRGGELASDLIVTKIKVETKKGKETAYKKDSFLAAHKQEIISLALNKAKLAEFPTKATPRISAGTIRVSFPKQIVSVKRVTIDEIESFKSVHKMHTIPKSNERLYEEKVKEGIKRILGEKGRFQDWGGETDDLFSTRIRINGKRMSVAFGLKGRGTNGILTPKKMGTQGDQIQRLFRTPADVYIVQYEGQIHSSIIEQMLGLATAKSVTEGRKIYYGIIDDEDTKRLVASYPKCFGK
jgi:hypothetical protein